MLNRGLLGIPVCIFASISRMFFPADGRAEHYIVGAVGYLCVLRGSARNSFQ